MTSLLKHLFDLCSLLSFKIWLVLNHRDMVFIDIDNTLAATAQRLKAKGSKLYKEDLAALDPLVGTFEFIDKSFKDRAYVFLSHRKLSTFFVTYLWLKKHSFWRRGARLYFVSHPNHKVSFFKASLEGSKQIAIIDDLSYNHELGQVRYYADVINFIEKNKIDYFDARFINTLNGIEPY
jgi:hypothetical protein